MAKDAYTKQLEEQVAALEERLQANDCETKTICLENNELKQELGPLYWLVIATFNRSICAIGQSQHLAHNSPKEDAKTLLSIIEDYKEDMAEPLYNQKFGIYKKKLQGRNIVKVKDGKWQTDTLRELVKEHIIDPEDPWEDTSDEC